MSVYIIVLQTKRGAIKLFKSSLLTSSRNTGKSWLCLLLFVVFEDMRYSESQPCFLIADTETDITPCGNVF